MIFQPSRLGDLHFFTLIPSASDEESIQSIYRELAESLQSQHAVLLSERIYASQSLLDSIQSIRESTLQNCPGATCCVPTFVEGRPFDGPRFYGVHAMAVVPTEDHPLEPLTKGGKAGGLYYRGRDAQYVFLPDVARLIPAAARQDRYAETYQSLQTADECLRQINWSFKDVRRTWFYLDEILSWYDVFNRARNDIFHSLGVMNGNPMSMVPASTGIWGRNARGHHCTLDLLAMRPTEGKPFAVRRIVNPKQNEATAYGSAFSRGMAVSLESAKYVFISGTASIDEAGVSVYRNDIERQIIRTLENVQTLLGVEHSELKDICQATAFVKHGEHLPIFHSIAKQMGLDTSGIVCLEADVCRDELLFELDAAAVMPTTA